MKTGIVYIFVLASMFCMPAFAGVVVTENVSPGATSWPGTPIISTVANPASTSVAESFNGGGGNTNLSETFTVLNTNYTLTGIDIYAGGGSGTGSGTNITLNLYDLGTQTAPNPSPYSGSIIGSNHFGAGTGLSINYVSQTPGVLEFDFTGADQVTLVNGHMYAFELTGVLNTTPVFWQRGTNDTYSGGAAYRNRSWINGSNARDFAMAIYGTGTTNTSGTNAPTSGQCTVNWNDVHQRIDGFGGGVVFLDAGLDPVTSANMDTLFLTNNSSQLGLTLIRIRIDSSTNWSTGLLDGQNAVARGARILATPWSPPTGMKSNNNIVGGSLLVSQYGNYANYLNGFAAYMGTNGAPLAAISIQNEPDANVTYESCVWTPAQLEAFCHTNASAITNAPLLMPESESFNTNYSDPTLNDPIAVSNVDIIGGHLYGVNTIVDYPNAHNKGKPTWMTEYLVNDQTIGTAIATAQQIYTCLTTANMSAYIWWKCLGNTNGLVNASGVPQKRGFVMAQWSWFVRPGYYRIGASTTGNALISAYQDTNSDNFAIVAINTSTSSNINQTFNLSNFQGIVSSVTPWITSATMSLSNQPPVAVSGASFSYTLPAQSVVTFVGQAGGSTSNTPPTLASVADRTINAGQTLLVTNTASDPNVPPQTLTFNLLNNPSGATLTPLDATNAQFSWRAPVSSAGTTNLVTLEVTDTGTLLSDTNSFNVIVNQLSSQPTVDSIDTSGGQVTLVLNGPEGPDYTVLTSTNLTDPLSNWQVLLTTNSPVTPVTLTLPVTTDPMRFYSIQIGP